MVSRKFDIDTSGVSDLFKDVYGAASDATFNASFPLISQMEAKDAEFVGNQIKFPVQTMFSGSNSFGELPDTNVSNDETVVLSDKSFYARMKIDRRTMKKAVKDKGAWVQGKKEFVRRTVESFTRQCERALLGDGALGTIATSGVSGSNPYVLTISDATWIEANWEEKDYINVASGTDQFEITAVDPSAKTITVTRLSGSQVPAQAEVIYLQKSKDNEPTGFKTIVDATSGTLYGITVARRWKSYQKDLSNSETISHELLNEAVSEMERTTGRVPTLITMSYVQHRKLKNQHEDLKRYVLRPKGEKYKAMNGFAGVMFESDKGDIPIIPHRFVPNDRVNLHNMDDSKFYRVPDWGWFDDDGTVFLRMEDEDAYEARYGGYGEFYHNVALQGRIKGLST